VKCRKNGTCRYLTTESVETFEERASIFQNRRIQAQHIYLG
jgi:hypothetical protein